MEIELRLLEDQQRILEMIACQAPLVETLAAITDWAGSMLPGALVSVMLYDPKHQTLSQVPSSAFSLSYIQLMQNLQVGSTEGACGPAAFYRKPMVTENIHTDPNWASFREAASQEGLRACWSTPILTSDGTLLGTFCAYYREPARPTRNAHRRLFQAASLVALTIVRDKDSQEQRSTEARYSSLFTQHPDGVYEFDREGCFLNCNQALERITGYSEVSLVGRNFRDFIDDRYRDLTQASFDLALAGEGQFYETMGTHADGHSYHLEITNLPIVIDGEIIGVYGICRDITQRKQREKDLRLLKQGIEATPNGVLLADATQPDIPLVYANEAFCTITGYQLEEILGRNCRFLQGIGTDPDTVAQIRQALADQAEDKVILRNYRRDGTPFWNQLTIGPVFDDQGTCTHFIGIQQDISQQREQEERLAFQASHDPLTRLPNRAALEARLLHDYRLSQQRQELLVVMYIDLDGFKSVNDGLGYDIGNQLLIAVADRLRDILGPDDTLARHTADEYVLLARGLTQEVEAISLAEKILVQLDSPFVIGANLLHISASIGIASNQQPASQPNELMQHASLAMRAAKRQGRNTWQWYCGDEVSDIGEHVRLRREIQEAIEQDQFELHYQPIVETTSGHIRSVEALIRWRHPIRGMVAPGSFIPLAEQTGQIIAIGRWVLRRACRDIATLNAETDQELPVAVNISPLQFCRTGFIKEVKQALADSGLPAHQLELEVTEGVLMSGTESAIELLSELRSQGIQVAIDDFGTGFSSLSYLRDLPINKIKLDRAFVCDITANGGNAAIVQGIITMAHHLGLVVVAEGIEAREQQLDLMQRGCDLLQGYLFSRPVPLEILRKLPSRLPTGADTAFVNQ